MPTIEDVKQLREESGMSITDCKEALLKGGSMEQARELLLAKGAELAKKRQDREAGEGIIDAYIHPTKRTGVLLDIRSETDFVARSEDFQALAHELSLQIAGMNPENVEELWEQDYIRDPQKKVKNLMEEYIAKLGENIVVRQFTRYQI